MIRFLFAFCILLIWLFFGIRYYQCNVKNLCETANVEHITTDKDTTTVIKSLPSIVATGFMISKNSATVRTIEAIDSVYKHHFDYLNKHQNEELIIKSFYTSDENDSIALVRANFIKEQFVIYGSNAGRIRIESVMKDFKYDALQQYAYGFDFAYEKISGDRLKDLDKGIANKTLYAGFASKTFKPDNTLHAYAMELKNYLDRHPAKKVLIVGHTDSSGDALANEWFGKERAKNVMQYFVSKGIDASKLKIESKGELTPIATNKTKEGRHLNRRIEINVTD